MSRSPCLRSAFLALAVVFLPEVAPAASVLRPTEWAARGGQSGAALGQSVAPAGDVNGDGYGDFLIGAPGDDTGASNAGAAFLHAGGPNGPGLSAAWSFFGTQGSAALGTAVAPAGDVNGDGFADVIVGAPLFDGAGSANQGRVYLFLGSINGLPAAPSQTLIIELTGGEFGASLAPAGDVNADGYDDVVIGAPRTTGAFASEGAVYVYEGGPGGGLSGPTWSKLGGSIAALLGYAVSGAGDVDADGFADVIVGAPGKSVSFARDGAAYVYRGSAAGLLAGAAASLHGASDSAAYGASVSLAGDVNADGYADVLVGSPNRQVEGTSYGSASLISGAPGGLGSALWAGSGTTARENYGVRVATIGDVNGDGFPDFAVGADRWPQPSERRGRIEVYLGGAGPLVLHDSLTGFAVGDAMGFAFATSGDTDANGFSELVPGLPGATDTFAGQGMVLWYRGSASPPVLAAGWPAVDAEAGAAFGLGLAGGIDARGTTGTSLFMSAPFADAGFTDAGRIGETSSSYPVATLLPAPALTGHKAEARLGHVLARAGDVDGDRFEDLLAGSRNYTNGEGSEGIVQLFRGSGSGLVAPAAWSLESNLISAQLGGAVAAGDFNGDGLGDVVVATLSPGTGPGRDGIVRVYPGSPSGLPAVATWTSPPITGDTFFGQALATGDWDGDGFSDLAIGAPAEDHGQLNEGRVYVFFGGPSGLDLAPAWSFETDVTSGQFGYSIANAGDANGDGVCDLLVGALTSFDSAHPNSGGEAWLFFGSTARAQPLRIHARRFHSDVPTTSFGSAVAGIGDVDKDGYGDFLVGAPLYSGGQGNEGRVFLFRGGEDGGADQPWWYAESNLAGAYFGGTLAAAGDVNHDGWPDFAVGAHLQPPGGAVYLYQGGGQATFKRIAQGATGPVNGLPIGAALPGPTDLFIHQTTRSPAGRSYTRSELHVATQGEAWSGGARLVIGPYDTGAPSPFTYGSSISYAFPYTLPYGVLVPGIAYRIRTRNLPHSPYFSASPWSQPRGSETADPHFRVAGAVIGVPDPAPSVPSTRVALGAARPSPFRDGTRIAYALPRAGVVTLGVFDAAGRHVRRLVGGHQAAGEHAAAFDGRDDRGQAVPGGVYFVVLDLDGERDVRKLVRLP